MMAGRENQCRLLAEKIVSFLETNDPAFGYAPGLVGQENFQQWVKTVQTDLMKNLDADITWFDTTLRRVAEYAESTQKYDVVEDAYTLIGEILHYEGRESPPPEKSPHREDDLTSTPSSDAALSPKDQLKQRLENGIRSVIDSEQFKNWLATGGKLFYNHLSIGQD